MKHAVIVSDEMTTLVGLGSAPDAPLPADAVMFLFSGVGDCASPTLTYRDNGDLAGVDDFSLVLFASRAACSRLFGAVPKASQSWHLSSTLTDLALSIIACEASGETRTTLRLARSIELLCQLHAALADGTLVAAGGDGAIAPVDVARIAHARRVIDQRWHEKLTIAELARSSGINRDKLVRGFRGLYGDTIAEVLSERRLSEARRMLLASNLPVATVAYRCSYLNNASFTRAFARRFGVAPTQLRRTGVAA